MDIVSHPECDASQQVDDAGVSTISWYICIVSVTQTFRYRLCHIVAQSTLFVFTRKSHIIRR